MKSVFWSSSTIVLFQRGKSNLIVAFPNPLMSSQLTSDVLKHQYIDSDLTESARSYDDDVTKPINCFQVDETVGDYVLTKPGIVKTPFSFHTKPQFLTLPSRTFLKRSPELMRLCWGRQIKEAPSFILMRALNLQNTCSSGKKAWVWLNLSYMRPHYSHTTM